MAGLEALAAEIRAKMVQAMELVMAKVLATMFEEVGRFYTAGTPVLYQRTGALMNSPHVFGVFAGGDTASFEAYLVPQDYVVPNPVFTERGYPSYFSGLQVLTAAEYGNCGVLGVPGFWRRTEQRIPQDLASIMGSFFSG